MRNRQLGNPMTPKGNDYDRSFKQDLTRLLMERKQKFVTKDRSIQRKDSQSGLRNRNESMEFENREVNVAQIMKVTKRKNSVRRQFVFPQQISQEQKRKEQRQTKGQKGFHRKGQMSVNPTGITHGFNFRNQKYLENSNYQTQVPQKSGPPPGLPKAGQSSKRQSLKNSTRELTSEQKALEFLKSFEKLLIKRSLNNWKNTCLTNKSQHSQKLQQKENQTGKKGIFNLLFVKKEGDNYTIQEVKDVLKKKQKTSTKVENQAIEPRQPLITAKPFEFIRIQSQSISDANSLKPPPIILNEKQASIQSNKEDKIIHQDKKKNIVQTQSKRGSHGKQSKISSKEQYQNFLQKFKQISDKIEKVQKEANQLNQDFSKLN